MNVASFQNADDLGPTGNWGKNPGQISDFKIPVELVELRRVRVVLRWATVFGFNSWCLVPISISNQPSPKPNSAFHLSGVDKWVAGSAEKAKAGTVHSVSGCTRGVQVKLWNPLRTCDIPHRLKNVFTTRRYTNPRLPYLTTETDEMMGVRD